MRFSLGLHEHDILTETADRIGNNHKQINFNKMRINASKYKVMRITKKKSPFTYHYHYSHGLHEHYIITEIVDRIGNDHKQINFNKMKINASKCKVMRITKKKSPFTYHYHIDGTKLDSVEYASQVWNPYTKSNINRIESIQRRATKFILKSDDDYLVRL